MYRKRAVFFIFAKPRIAGPRLGYKHTEETLAKMRSRKHSLETRLKMSEAKKGKTHTEETLAILRGRNISEETRRKMSEAGLGREKPVGSGRPCQKIEVFDNKNNQATIYDSISEAARALGIKKSVISWYFARNANNSYKGRYIFKKV
jgi:group I intron endonuclease